MIVATHTMPSMPAQQLQAPDRKQTIRVEESVYLALLRTAYALEEEVAAWLKPHGLSATQYNALRILRGAGPEGLLCREVGARMLNRDPDITRLLDRLEKHGLVRRTRGKKDRRVIFASITSQGLELLKKLDRPLPEFLRVRLQHLSSKNLQALIALMKKIQNC